jgi:hypothetical protein
MYITCFCAPIIEAPLYIYKTELKDDTGKTLNLPVITNQVKMNLRKGLPPPPPSPSPSNTLNGIKNLKKFNLTVPIGVWLNVDETYTHTPIKRNNNRFSGPYGDFPSFIFDIYFSNDNIDIKLDFGYYKNVNIKNMTNNITEFSLIIKLEYGILNIYLNAENSPIISIDKQQYGYGWINSPEYTKLNATYRYNGYANAPGGDDNMLEIQLAFPIKDLDSSISSYNPTKPVTNINKNIIRNTNNIINKNNIVKDSLSGVNGAFWYIDNLMVFFNPDNFPAII